MYRSYYYKPLIKASYVITASTAWRSRKNTGSVGLKSVSQSSTYGHATVNETFCAPGDADSGVEAGDRVGRPYVFFAMTGVEHSVIATSIPAMPAQIVMKE